MMTRYLRNFAAALLMASTVSMIHAALPEGFVYLDDLDSTIQTSMRYATKENFVGAVVDGYKVSRIIMTKQAAQALCLVQKELLQEGYSLVVYDAYRPQKAVDHFIRWSNNLQDISTKNRYYPNIAKDSVFDLGYVAKRSGHSRGSTIDLSIIQVDKKLKKPILQVRTINGHQIPFFDDGTVDMGSSFDLLDEASHHDSPKMTDAYNSQRHYLREKMLKHGFKMYSQEWWHYTLVNEPFPNTFFDFDIE